MLNENSVVAVVFGGVSNENEISVITGTMAANVLKSGGVDILPVYIAQSGEFFSGKELLKLNTYKQNDFKKCSKAIIADGGVYLLNKRGKVKKHVKVDCVLNCCHGGWGEGGGLSGICAAADLPLAGAGTFESAAFMDKYLTKIVLAGLGVRVAPYRYVRPNCRDMCGFPYPLIVKPATLGSSIGIQKVADGDELKSALDCAFIYDGAAIVEKYLEPRREINCAAYYANDEIVVSECEEAVTSGDILSFEDKYQGGGKSVIPADIPAEIATCIRETTRTVYEKLNMRGIVRFDYILSGEEVFLSEVNTVPGSLAYYLFAKSFKSFFGVLESVISQAQKDFTRSRKKLLTTGILENIPENSAKAVHK